MNAKERIRVYQKSLDKGRCDGKDGTAGWLPLDHTALP